MAKSQLNDFDFDHWSQLAQDDPEGFEKLRNKTIEFHISQATKAHQTRLRCLQWRIDRIRETANSPMAACISISGMMWDSLHQLSISYKQLDNLTNGVPVQLPKADILKFEARSGS